MRELRRLTLRLPEGAAFSWELADLGSRFAAWALDAAAVAVAFTLAEIAVSWLQILSRDIGGAAHVIAYFALNTFYAILLEWLWRGQTLGKRFFKLRVLDLGGGKLSFSQAALRNILRAVDRLPAFYGVGALASLLSPRFQRLGDLAASTVVVREREGLKPQWEALGRQSFNSLKKHLRLCARLRRDCSPKEAELCLRALMRRDRMEAPARLELFKRLAAHLKSKVEFPAEDAELLTDEQYVKNVVEVLYETPGKG